jgi:YD repeat-containing protein
MARRLITVCSPIIIFGLFALFPLLGGFLLTGRRSAVRLEGPARVVVAGLAFAIGLGLAIRNALVGITYSGDLITVVNGFRTWRIPAGQVGQFRWTKEGLVVEWHDTAGRPQRTPVDAFHRGKNPMADLTRGQRAHGELEVLRAGR